MCPESTRSGARGRRFIAGLAAPLLVLCSACAPAHTSVPQLAARFETVSFTVSEGTRLTFDVTPDGQAVIFDLLGQLWRVPLEGGEAVALTNAVRETAEDLDPAVSPDGRHIVFQSDRPGGRALWLMPAEGGQPRRLTSRPIDYFVYPTPAWSPDGRRIVYSLGEKLLVLDVDTDRETELTVDSLPPSREVPPWTARAAVPSWTPDGTRIVFGNASGTGGLWEVNAAGGAARRGG